LSNSKNSQHRRHLRCRSSGIESESIGQLGQAFFARPAITVARELLGKTLVRSVGGKTISAIISETEAYIGPHDKACHANRGKTTRTEVMYGPPGFWYVYFIYGMHWMLNVVTGDEGYPAAVLFRGTDQIVGPGRLTKAMQIARELNGQPASPTSGLWIEDRGIAVPRGSIKRTPRIGVAYAAEWAPKPYRFVLK
jgi:DNA-3-methyladenine glycosylase